MKHVLTFLCMCAGIALGTQAWALQEVPSTECSSNADCADGQVCELEPCPMIDCDPDDPDCVVPECSDTGTCVDGPDDGWGSSCETDADCPQGFECGVVGGVSEACAAGEDCPEPTVVEIYGCVPASCETDADCEGAFVCITYENDCEDIAIGAPDCAGEDCPPPPEIEPCEPTTEGVCGPKWAAPCEKAADCGEGFQCVPEVVDTCGSTPISSGGAVPSPAPDAPPTEPADDEEGSEGASSGSDGAEGTDSEGDGAGAMPAEPAEGDEPIEDDCQPEETGKNICEPIEVACNTDADCALDDWTCQSMGTVTVVAMPCPEDDPDCNPVPEPDEPVASEGVCVPPGWNTYSPGGGGVALSEQGAGDKNSDSTSAPPSTPGDTEEASDDGSSGPSVDDGGCNAGKSSGGLVWAILSLFFGIAVRRRSAAENVA